MIFRFDLKPASSRAFIVFLMESKAMVKRPESPTTVAPVSLTASTNRSATALAENDEAILTFVQEATFRYFWDGRDGQGNPSTAVDRVGLESVPLFERRDPEHRLVELSIFRPDVAERSTGIHVSPERRACGQLVADEAGRRTVDVPKNRGWAER